MGSCSCSCSDKNELTSYEPNNNNDMSFYSHTQENQVETNVTQRCQFTTKEELITLLQSYVRTHLALKSKKQNKLGALRNKNNKAKPNLQITIEDENGFGRGQPLSKSFEDYINEQVKKIRQKVGDFQFNSLSNKSLVECNAIKILNEETIYKGF